MPAGAAFPLRLWLKLSHPESIAAQLLFFCLEAALVGGIADWFAVTALFRKPLGIPWHTALIPRSRDSLIDGCSSMAAELISQVSLVKSLKESSLLDRLLPLAEEPAARQQLLSGLTGFLEKKLQAVDTESAASGLEKALKKYLREYDISGGIAGLADRFINSGRDADVYFQLISLAEEMLQDRKVHTEIEKFLQEEKEKLSSESIAFRIGIKMLQASGVLDIRKAAGVLHGEILAAVRKLRSDEAMRQWFIREMRSRIRKTLQSYEWKLLAESLQQETVDRLHLTKQLQQMLDAAISSACRPQANAEALPARRGLIIELTEQLLDTAENMLRSDPETRRAAEALLQDFSRRAVLQAHAMLSSLIKDIMVSMDTEKLNGIIYSKTEQDLVWIRLNGSITGAVIGFFLFWLLQLPQLL